MQCANSTHDDNVDNRSQRQHHISVCDWNFYPPDVGGSSAEEWKTGEGPPPSVSSDSASPRFDPVPANRIQHDTAVLHAIRCETGTDIRVLRRHKVSTLAVITVAYSWRIGDEGIRPCSFLASKINNMAIGSKTWPPFLETPVVGHEIPFYGVLNTPPCSNEMAVKCFLSRFIINRLSLLTDFSHYKKI